MEGEEGWGREEGRNLTIALPTTLSHDSICSASVAPNGKIVTFGAIGFANPKILSTFFDVIINVCFLPATSSLLTPVAFFKYTTSSGTQSCGVVYQYIIESLLTTTCRSFHIPCGCARPRQRQEEENLSCAQKRICL